MEFFSIEFENVTTGFERDVQIRDKYYMKAENAKTKFGRAWYNYHAECAGRRAERKFLVRLLQAGR